MPTVTLVPISLTDSNSNVAAGAYTDIDETIAAADGSTLDSVQGDWVGSPSPEDTAFTFGMSNMPAEATEINSVWFRARARVTGTASFELNTYKCDVQGTNAPTTTGTWKHTDDGDGFENKGATSWVTSSATVSQVNSWVFRVYQSFHSDEGTATGNLEIDCLELQVTYNEEPPEPPSEPPTGGGYTVLPSTDTSIYGLCIAQARDFVVLGGLDADRYSIRWSAIGDPTDWPTPATDDARAKQSGSQSFPTRFGYVTAIAGDDFSMLVFQEGAVHRATYVGGDVVWNFDTIDESRGCVRQGRMVKAGDLVFFQSMFGYHVARGGQIEDIGYGKVDDSFN